MVKIKFKREDLLEILKEELEFLTTPIECDDCLEASKNVYLEIYENGILIREVCFLDRFSYPIEKDYAVPLKATIEEIGGEHLKYLKEAREYINGSIEIESIEIYQSLAERMIRFLSESNSEDVCLMMCNFSKFYYLISGDRVFRIKRWGF